MQPNAPKVQVPENAPPSPSAKVTKLDRVYEMQNRDVEISINLSNSLKNSKNNPSESFHNPRNSHPQASE